MTPREIAEQIFEYLEGKSCPESRSVAINDVERIVARALGKSQGAECECCRRLQAHLDDAEATEREAFGRTGGCEAQATAGVLRAVNQTRPV